MAEKQPDERGAATHLPVTDRAPTILQRSLLYKQLEESLRSRILSGELPVGTRLPSDAQFCQEYGISRVTVRKALDRLAADGLIRRDVGRGTFVSEPHRPSSPITALALIGFVAIGDVTPFSIEILRGIEDAARREGHFVLFTSSNYDPVQESAHIQTLVDRGVHGLVILPTFTQSHALENLAASGFPAVLVDRYFNNLALDCVTSDNELGGYQATRHLLELGHRRIGFVGLVPLSSSSDRYRGHCHALREWGVEPDSSLIVRLAEPLYDEARVLVSGNPEDTRAFPLVRDMLERERPTALVTFNEYFTIVTLAAMRALKLSVGRDISLVGFDRDARRFQPDLALTIVTQAPFELGATAVQVLMERIAGRSNGPRRVRLPTQLVVRRSTRRLAATGA